MKRTLVIGDIHGGLKALLQVLERAAASAADTLIFLGDYVDGWSESAGVVEYIRQLGQQQRCICLKGNHDEWCEDWLRTGNADKNWVLHGGLSTIKSYALVDESLRISHLRFFEQMKWYTTDAENRLFLHAGFTSPQGPENELHISNLGWDRTLWETAVILNSHKIGNSSLPQRLKRFHEIYIGHTPTLYYNVSVPMKGANVWNMDTGAAFHGKLSVMDIDTKAFWQSDMVKTLYPNETGRNRS